MLTEAQRLCDDFTVIGHPLVRMMDNMSALSSLPVPSPDLWPNQLCSFGHLQQNIHAASEGLTSFFLQTTFETDETKHIGDAYFIESNDKIRYFLEPSALSPATPSAPARLLAPPSRSINKIGHALAPLNPVFWKHTLEADKIRDFAKELGEHESPRVLQSMIICKQPRIGGGGASISEA